MTIELQFTPEIIDTLNYERYLSGPVRKGAILTGEKGCQVAIVG